METAGCPGCGDREASSVGFTWWGGALGPRLLSHVRCLYCGVEYNGKTGRSNRNAIIVYMVVVVGITLPLALGLTLMR